jgi:hypothetical protein
MRISFISLFIASFLAGCGTSEPVPPTTATQIDSPQKLTSTASITAQNFHGLTESVFKIADGENGNISCHTEGNPSRSILQIKTSDDETGVFLRFSLEREEGFQTGNLTMGSPKYSVGGYYKTHSMSDIFDYPCFLDIFISDKSKVSGSFNCPMQYAVFYGDGSSLHKVKLTGTFTCAIR